MIWLRQSTARTIKFGPFVDKTDGVALETGLVTAMDNATTGIRVSKNSGAYADRASATAPTYDAMGDYNVELGTSDTDTLGVLKIIFEEAATCLPVWQEFMVVPANVWDSLFGADKLQVDATQISGDTTAADNLESACDNYSATRGLTGTALPAAVADAAGGVPVSDAGGLDLDAMNTNVSDIETRQQMITGTAAAGAASTVTLDAAAPAVVNRLIGSQVEIVGGTGQGQARFITAYTAGRVATIDPVWVTNPSTDSVYRVTGPGRTSLTTSDNAVVTGIQSDLDNGTDGLGALKALIDTANTATAAIQAVTDLLPNAGALTTIGTDTARLTAARADVLTDWVDAGRLDAILDAIKAVTDALPDAGALTTIGTDTARLTSVRAAVLTDWINGGRLDLLLDAIKVVTDAITTTGTGLTAMPWNAAWDAEVESEVNDALDTAITELGVGVIVKEPTLRTALMAMYMLLRNLAKTQTSGTDALECYNDAGTLIWKKLLTDDTSDYVEAKVTSG